MADTLKDQLLALGFKPVPREKPGPGRSDRPVRLAPETTRRRDGASTDTDLASAYAARARAEREERARAQREAESRAREKRERAQRLAGLLEGKSLNDPQAEIARHFPHGTKIRRIHVNAAQLERLNAGELGVVQVGGRYLLVERAVAIGVGELSPEALILLPAPGAATEDDVPPDLVW